MAARALAAAPAALMVLLLAAGIAARPRPLAEDPAEDVAAERMARARALRRELSSVPGEERAEAREAAVSAYREIYRAFPQRALLASEAAFRAGELLRAAGAGAEARLEFRRAQHLAPGSVLAARAGLELAHIDRREARLREALAAYMLVAESAHAPPGQRDEALLWAARVQAERGRGEEARDLWERVAATAEDPLDRVRAYDQLARELVHEGDLEGAAGMLARARARLASVALEETQRGARVAAALEGMRSLELLKKEVARRRDGVRITR